MKSKRKYAIWYDDRKLLVICLVMSGLIWSVLKLTKEYSITIGMPIVYIQSDSMSFEEKPLALVNYKIAGRGIELLRFQGAKDVLDDTIDIVLDETSQISIPKTFFINFLENKISNLSIQEVSPEIVTVKQTRASVKKVPIQVPYHIDLSDNYIASSRPILSPDSILIKGPKLEIDHISYWNTDSLRLSGVSDTVHQNIDLAPNTNSVITLSTQYTSFFLPVELYTEHSLFVPIQIINYSGEKEIDLFPSRIQIKFKLPVSRYDAVKTEDFIANVDFNNRIAETNNIVIHLAQYPAYVKDITFKPIIAEYFFKEKRQYKD